MTKTPTKSDHQIAEEYNETGDVSDFGGPVEPVEVRRDVTISVRFSAEEIESLRRRAAENGTKVTAFIRAAALGAERAPLDLAALTTATEVAEEQLRKIRQSLRPAESSAGRFDKVEVYEDTTGTFRFRLKASDGKVIATSEAYRSRTSALEGAAALQRPIGSSIVVA